MREAGSDVDYETADTIKEHLGRALDLFTAPQPEFVYLRELVKGWGMNDSKISTCFKSGSLPKPRKGRGNQKQVPRSRVLQYLYTRAAGKYSIPALRVSRDLLEVRANLNLPMGGAGLEPDTPSYGLFDLDSNKILVGNQTPILGDYLWVALLCWVDEIQELIPGQKTLPASPVDAIRLLLDELGYADDVSQCFGEPEQPERSEIDPRVAEPRLEVDREHLFVVAAKIAGAEAPYIRQCFWVAIIAASFPWSEAGLIDFVNRIIVDEGGKPLSRETVYSRISLARSHLFLKLLQPKMEFSALPESQKVGDLLRKIPDALLAEAWRFICAHAEENSREAPTDEDCLRGWELFSEAKSSRELEAVDFSRDEQKLRDQKAKAARAKLGKELNKRLEAVGIVDPREAFLKVLCDLGVAEDVSLSLADELLHD